MNINELDDTADVFRFTAFDGERDGGRTVRKMDWILRNRAGLMMRYHMHEVIAIGKYVVKNTNWVVREVVKPGSWHTSAGHGSTTSAKRYEFDLALLYKDLEAYGHDPHTHYYLGVTHHSLAVKAYATLGLYHQDVQAHTESALRYMELRATAHYEEELMEERWAVMLELAKVYMGLQVSITIYIRHYSTTFISSC